MVDAQGDAWCAWQEHHRIEKRVQTQVRNTASSAAKAVLHAWLSHVGRWQWLRRSLAAASSHWDYRCSTLSVRVLLSLSYSQSLGSTQSTYFSVRCSRDRIQTAHRVEDCLHFLTSITFRIRVLASRPATLILLDVYNDPCFVWLRVPAKQGHRFPSCTLSWVMELLQTPLSYPAGLMNLCGDLWPIMLCVSPPTHHMPV